MQSIPPLQLGVKVQVEAVAWSETATPSAWREGLDAVSSSNIRTKLSAPSALSSFLCVNSFAFHGFPAQPAVQNRHTPSMTKQ